MSSLSWLESQKIAQERWSLSPIPAGRDHENYRSISLKELDRGLLPREEAAAQVPLVWRELGKNESEICLVSSAERQPLFLNESARSKEGVFSTSTDRSWDWTFSGELAEDFFAQWAVSRAPFGLVVQKKPDHVFSSGRDVARATYFFDPKSDCFFYRTVIEISRFEKFRYVEEFVGGPQEGRNGTAVGLIQIRVCEGATLDYSWIQNWSENVTHFARIEVIAERESQVKIVPFQMGGKQGQLRIEKKCTGSGAKIEVEGAAQGRKSQQFDFWIRSLHEVPDTQSHMLYHTVMGDDAKAVFNGKIVIGREALRTKATQKNKNILLSSRASVDTFPKLEIATDEVECAHGASSSPILPEQRYYLESRGIATAEAEAMIIRGVIDPTLSRIASQSVQTRVRKNLGLVEDDFL